MFAVPVERESLLELEVAQLVNSPVAVERNTYFERRVQMVSITRRRRNSKSRKESRIVPSVLR